jgi:hypothetical protein
MVLANMLQGDMLGMEKSPATDLCGLLVGLRRPTPALEPAAYPAKVAGAGEVGAETTAESHDATEEAGEEVRL